MFYPFTFIKAIVKSKYFGWSKPHPYDIEIKPAQVVGQGLALAAFFTIGNFIKFQRRNLHGASDALQKVAPENL